MDGYIGEIRAFGFDYAPLGWAFCNGQGMSVQQQQALYAVIGNMYGGNTTTFNLPNIQGRAAMATGTGPGLTPRYIAQAPGELEVNLLSNQLPVHSHNVNVITSNINGDAANSADPANNYWANGFKSGRPPTYAAYIASATKTPAIMAANMVQPVGTATPPTHYNMQPYLVFNICICLDGEFPIRP